VLCVIQKALDNLEVHMYNWKVNDSIYKKFKLMILIIFYFSLLIAPFSDK